MLHTFVWYNIKTWCRCQKFVRLNKNVGMWYWIHDFSYSTYIYLDQFLPHGHGHGHRNSRWQMMRLEKMYCQKNSGNISISNFDIGSACTTTKELTFSSSSSSSINVECLKSIAPKCSCLFFCIIPCNPCRWYLCYMSYIPTLHITSLTFHAGASTSPRVAVHALSRPSIHVPLPELIN